MFYCHFCAITVSKVGWTRLHGAAQRIDKRMFELFQQRRADVNSSDGVSYSCQLFYLFLILVQVCVVPNNPCFGSKVPVGPSCWTGSLFI